MRLIITIFLLNIFLGLGFSQDSVIVDKSFRYRNSIQIEHDLAMDFYIQ